MGVKAYQHKIQILVFQMIKFKHTFTVVTFAIFFFKCCAVHVTTKNYIKKLGTTTSQQRSKTHVI